MYDAHKDALVMENLAEEVTNESEDRSITADTII